MTERTRANKIILVVVIGLGVLAAAIVALVAFIIALSVASDGASNDSSGAPAAIDCDMDVPCKLGDAAVTITKVTRPDALTRPTNHVYRGDWVVVQFDYTWRGSSPAETTVPGYRAWRLKDGEGRTYKLNHTHTSSHDIAWNRDLMYSDVNPGVAEEGVIIFETAPDAKDLSLEVVDLVSPRNSKRAEVPLWVEH